MDLLHHYQQTGQVQPYSDWNMQALLFAPVRFLANNHSVIEQDEETLEELIHALQCLLIR